MTLNFDQLRHANIARNEEWNVGSEKVSPAFRGNELAGETGEACNILKKLERERIGIVGSRASLENLGKELADVVICADLAAMDFGLDLGKFLVEKFNETSEKYGLSTRLLALQPSDEMVLVPRVPTDEMLTEAHFEQISPVSPYANFRHRAACIYRAMIAAAPSPTGKAEDRAMRIAIRDQREPREP